MSGTVAVSGLPAAQPLSLADLALLSQSWSSGETSSKTTLSGLVAFLSMQSSCATIAALRLKTTATLPQAICFVLGYYTGADGGEGIFWLNASDTTSADNGGTIIVDASGRRWYRQTGGAGLNFRWFGGSVTDSSGSANLGAFNAMMAVAVTQTGGATVVFPPGKYNFSGQATVTYPAGSIFALKVLAVGAVLCWPNAAGGMVHAFSMPSHTLEMDGGSITTGVAGGGTGLLLTQSNPLLDFFQSSVSNVVFRGDNNNGATGGTNYWNTGAKTSNASGTAWLACSFYGSASQQGTGLAFTGTGSVSADYSIYNNVWSCIFNSLNIGMLYGSYSQGLTVLQCNTQNTTSGFVAQSSETGQLSQLQIADSQYACTGNNITIQSSIGNVFIEHNDIFVMPGYAGVLITANQGVIITGNSISASGATGSTGIQLDGTVSQAPSTITGNTISTCNIGISLLSGAQNVISSGNAVLGCTNAIEDAGTGNQFFDNLGVLPVTSAPSPTSSPWLYTSGNRPEALYVSASTSINSITQQDGSYILSVATGANVPVAVQLLPHTAVSIGFTGTLTAHGTKL